MYSEPCLEFSIVCPNWCIQESLFSHHFPYQWNHDCFVLFAEIVQLSGTVFLWETYVLVNLKCVKAWPWISKRLHRGWWDAFGVWHYYEKKNKKLNGNMTWALLSPLHTLANVIFTIGFFILSLDFWTKCMPSKVSLLSFVYGKISMPNLMAKCSLDSTMILNVRLQIWL